METVNDIVREMRAYAKKSEIDGGMIDVWDWLPEFADRIEAAYKRDLQALVDAGEIDMRTAMGEVERLRAENARLMATAPELYEALRLACGSCIDCDKDCSDCINFNRSWMPAARAALEKAGGAK